MNKLADGQALAVHGHPGLPPEPHDLPTAWSWEPTVLLWLALLAWLYLIGIRSLWRRAGRGRGISCRRVVAFAGGVLTLFVALASPIDAVGTALFSAVDGVVVDPSSSGSPGSAYGVHPFRIRSGGHDVLIGHTIHVFVRPGQQVHRGQRIALAGDSGAPDGCHLHFEVRSVGGGLSSASDPAGLLRLD